MLIQLPEEKEALIFPLFKKTQPNRSALAAKNPPDYEVNNLTELLKIL